MIARCSGATDVSAAVTFARTNELLVAIRAGGHSVSGSSVCDSGLLIDLSLMKGIHVDPSRRTVRAESGMTWGEFDRETQEFGLATTGGIVSTTGIAGLTLGGGIGYLNRKYGLTCDNLISANVVIADGQLLVTSAEENSDLFWALRGGGGNFGVVTSLEYRLHPLGRVLGGVLAYPLDRASEALRFYRDFSLTAPDEVRADATCGGLPNGAGLVITVCYCGSVQEGEQVLQPLRRFGRPLVDTIAPVPYTTVQGLLEAVLPPVPHFHYAKSSFLKEFSDDAINSLVDFYAATDPSPVAGAAIEHLGGAISRVGATDTAFYHRSPQHSFLVSRHWRDPAESERNMQWSRNLYETMKPFLQDGVYVNYLSEGEGQVRVRAAYGANYERLVRIKNRYDPTNLFRLNQNIQPAAHGN